MRCGKGHDHQNVAEVRACYGVTGSVATDTMARPDYSSRRSGGQGPITRFASEKQVKFITDLLLQREIPVNLSGMAELLWAQCEAHDIDVRTPGDGTRMPADIARSALDILTQLPKKQSQVEQDRWKRDENKAATRQPVRFPDIPATSYVPAGHYAVPSLTGNNDLDFFRVDRPMEGKWAGYIFVKRVIGGRPNAPVRGQKAREALVAISKNPEAAALQYATELGRCSKCNRHLTDELSRQLGMGPECRSK